MPTTQALSIHLRCPPQAAPAACVPAEVLEGSQGAGHFPMSPFVEDSPAGQVRHALWLSMPRPSLGLILSCWLTLRLCLSLVASRAGRPSSVLLLVSAKMSKVLLRICACSPGGMQGLRCKPVAARESRTSALVLQAMAKTLSPYAGLLLHSLKCSSCSYAAVNIRQHPVLLEVSSSMLTLPAVAAPR